MGPDGPPHKPWIAACAACGAELRRGAPFCAQCGTEAPEAASPDATDPLLGQVIARKFKILAVLGEGGMGRVYRAEQLPLGVEVVIKTLHARLTSDPTLVERFFREAQAASRLRHPNCVSVLDFGDSDGVLYIGMELLRGRSLARVLAEDGAFAPARALRVMSQVLDVLEAAHQMNIVHRDLKPENIMVADLVTQRDFVKVLDFGIAKILDPMGRGGAKLTQTGMIFGTPSYMSPEQAMGGEIDGRTDLYAVGVLLFELLTEQLPFRADSLALLLAEQATKPAPPILTVRAELAPALAALVDRALSKNPDDRPQTALEMKSALEAALTPVAPRTISGQLGMPAVQPPCPRCGQPVRVTAKFCGECGASTGHAAPDKPDKFADLRRYLSSSIVEDLSHLRARAAGEKRDVVVLVVDLTVSGSGAESERAMEDAIAQLSEVALRHTGSLERGLGTGVVVVFGLTMTHADDAERAVTAALEMREALKSYPAKGWTFEATYAIHAGAAVLGASERAFTPVGDTVELPLRLAAAAGTDKVLVTEQIHQQIRSRVELRQMQAITLKGRSTAVPVFEVANLRVVAGGASHLAFAQPPMVGRAHALDAILGAITEVGGAMQIVGEPGIGKTRLLEELCARLSARHMVAILASGRPAADGRSPALARIVAALGGSPDALRALGVETYDARLLFRHLQPGSDVVADESVRQTAVATVLRTAVELLAKRTPVVLLIDDAHAADPTTLAFVARCMLEPIARTTVIATCRPGYATPWDAAQTPSIRTATLPHLPDDAIAELVAAALTPTPPPRDLATAVCARAGGSPLMALEVLRSMVDAGVLTSIGGRWTLTGDLGGAAKPGGLRALFAARIDALPASARDVLACAAVIGDEVAIDLLNRVVVRANATPIIGELELLASRGLLTTDPASERLRFTETSAREAIYERLAPETRRPLHQAAAHVLEQSLATDPVPVEAIAEHHARAGEPARALVWLAKAADAALAARDYTRAVSVLRRAREIARAGDNAMFNRRLAEDSLRLGDVFLEIGDLATVREVIAEGLTCAHKDDDPVLIARLRRARGRAQLGTGDVERAIVDLDAALTAAIGHRDRLLMAELHGDLGEAHEKRGDLVKATDYMMRALELVQGGGAADVQRVVLRLLIGLGRTCVRTKDLDRAERFLQQALELLEDRDDKLAGVKVLGNLGAVWHARGDLAAAQKLTSRALELAREAGDLVGAARQLTNLGTLSAQIGDAAGARRHYDAAFAMAQRTGWREGMAAAAAARDRLSSTKTPAR